MPNRNFLAFIVSEVSAFIRTARQPGIRAWQAKIGLELDRHGQAIRIVILIKNIYMRLVILIKNIYTLWGRKRFLLPVTYFLTNLYILLLYE